MTSLSETSMLAGSSGVSTGYTIDQSIRFNDDDSPSLDRTYSSTGSRTTFTFSIWIKLGNYDVGSGFPLFNGGEGTSDTTWTGFGFYQGKIYVQGFNTNWRISTRLLRDPSAWYHIVYVWDTTNAIADERVRVYVNGTRETEFSTYSNPSVNANAGIGQAAKHTIGYQSRTVGFGYADAYFAEMHFLDGYAYGPEYFGETKENTDIWIPKEYTGSYGTNGFKIDGRDSSDLGDDESGNGNDYSSTNLAAHDQVTDSPTNNFAVLNSIIPSTVTYSQGNLKNVISGSESTAATMGAPSGKWYYEVYINTVGNTYLGVCSNRAYNFTSYLAQPESVGLNKSGDIYIANPSPSSSPGVEGLPSISSSDIIGVAYDVDNTKVWWSKNGQWYTADASSESTINISDVEAGNDAYVFSFMIGEYILPMFGTSTSAATYTINFGQEGTFAGATTAGGNSDGNGIGNFKYTVPSGYLALCSLNLGS